MSNIKTGAVGWSDVKLGGGKKVEGKDLWLRLNPGSNIVRLITDPYQYWQHRVMLEGGKRYGYRINCAGKDQGCPCCEMTEEQGQKAKRRWLVGVIDRKTNTTKILDIGYTVFEKIQALSADLDWGSPREYDLDILVNPNGGATGYYNVIAKPKKQVVSDIVLAEEFDISELEKRTSLPTSEKVQDRLNRINEEISGTSAAPVVKAATKVSNVKVVENAADAEFKNFDDDDTSAF